MCRENVGIATTRFQSLKDVSGNYVRHLWGTMRVCHALAGNLYSLGLAVDSRIVRIGLKVWRCSGCGEDVVDELDAFRCGQEWTVLGVLVEMPHEGVKAGVGDADALGRDVPRPEENCRGVFLPKMRKDEPRSPPHLCTGGLLPKGAERLGVHDTTLPGV